MHLKGADLPRIEMQVQISHFFFNYRIAFNNKIT